MPCGFVLKRKSSNLHCTTTLWELERIDFKTALIRAAQVILHFLRKAVSGSPWPGTTATFLFFCMPRFIEIKLIDSAGKTIAHRHLQGIGAYTLAGTSTLGPGMYIRPRLLRGRTSGTGPGAPILRSGEKKYLMCGRKTAFVNEHAGAHHRPQRVRSCRRRVLLEPYLIRQRSVYHSALVWWCAKAGFGF